MKCYLFLLTLLMLTVSIRGQTDCQGCSDYPVLPRMPGFFLENYGEEEYGAQDFFIDLKKQTKEGRKISIRYRHPDWKNRNGEFPSRLQILRNYTQAISTAGGNVLFERPNYEFGHYQFKTNDTTNVWVEVRPTLTGNAYTLTLIEQQEMRQDIVVGADLIKDKLALYGKVSLEGIYFDTGKATIKPASQPAILEIAKYLKAYPETQCWVVGHTSSEGTFEVNSRLSLARATAIKNELVQTYNIAENRLFAEGVGPLAPVVTNQTEMGRSLNRRVELVLK